ncbi:U-box domain-containing protein 15-like [Impatiens glandulifera]|uniref:U-box domain-containing protein 15-like n=1 Tax=Impatiens glandulifera TaxID=253017 RepID=UPI001FB04FC8|nr:U-box domain-containing protein 15-like [Impatiens glandulifera]
MEALRKEIHDLTALIESINSIGDYRMTQKKEACNLIMRLKLLVPLLEEMKDLESEFAESAISSLSNLNKAILAAKALLKTCHEGSKIYLALESENVLLKFHHVYEQLIQALDDMPYSAIGISEEVKEQIKLMHIHLRKAKRTDTTQDMELTMDIMVVLSTIDNRNVDRASIERLANKLVLHGTEDLRIETLAVKNLIEERGQNTEGNQQILKILRNLKQVAGMEEETTMVDIPSSCETLSKSASLQIPNEFLCPISLEIMMDPVIVATGQTYERESIQKWLDTDHKTCPKTGLVLAHQFLVPNFALKNIISQWCKKKNYNFPEKVTTSSGSLIEQSAEIVSLVRKLSSTQLEVQRKAVTEIRMISKESPEKRISIAHSGGIPPLVQLLYYPDSTIQENAVTTLLNLSIEESNKKLISEEEPFAGIIEILQNGSICAKENSAAAIFSLSMLDENKAKIGSLNGIPPLVDLLQNGTIRGKKDAATALFNLSLNRANRGRAIEVGIISTLLKFLEEKNIDMVNETLSLLLILASNVDGRQEMGKCYVIRMLVNLIEEGTRKNKECAAALLLELGNKDPNHLMIAVRNGVYEHLVDLSCNGSSRGQRKANSLMDLMKSYKLIP